MKKISVLLIALLLVASVVFAATVQSTDSMSFYGQIGLGTTTFGVTESANNTSTTPIDLLSAAMLPDATGVKIGSWTFTGVNQIAKNYTLLYTFGALTATVAGQTYNVAYELQEEGTTAFFGSMTALGDAQTAYSADAGSPEESRDIFARLTTAGRTAALAAAASSNYISTIQVQLIAQ